MFSGSYCDHVLLLGAKIELTRVGELSLAEHLQGARVTLVPGVRFTLVPGVRLTLAVSFTLALA